METVPKNGLDRHHLLYPRRVWNRLGPEYCHLRGIFVVKIRQAIHRKLHHTIDPTLGEHITESQLPDESTLLSLEKASAENESEIKAMSPFEKIDWLDGHLEDNDSSTWLKNMLQSQRELLQASLEEP